MTATTPQSAAPAMPAEHGAWVVLSVPMLMVWLAFGPRPVPAALLLISVAAGWLAQSTAPAALKAGGRRGWWLAAEVAIFAGAGLALLVGWRLWALIPLGLVAALFAALHAWMRTKVIKRRLDRSEPGELIGVLGLCLTAPAAYVVSRGGLDANAAVAYGACAVFFGSGVLFVQMLLKRLRARKQPGASRWQAARNVAIYHAAVALALMATPLVLPPRSALFVVAAFVPVLVRALWGVATMKSTAVPSFKKIGVLESVYAVWFAAMIAVAISP